MEAIVPAFLLALLAQLGDRPAALTALLADRYDRPLRVALAAGLAHAAGNAAAAVAGAAMAPMLNPNARALLLAMALVLAGLGGFRAAGIPHWIASRHMGALVTPFAGVVVLSLADRTQFLTLAIATDGLPLFSAIGAALGAFSVAFVAAVLGDAGWRKLPLRWLRIGTSLIFLIAGAYLGLGALRLV